MQGRQKTSIQHRIFENLHSIKLKTDRLLYKLSIILNCCSLLDLRNFALKSTIDGLKLALCQFSTTLCTVLPLEKLVIFVGNNDKTIASLQLFV